MITPYLQLNIQIVNFTKIVLLFPIIYFFKPILAFSTNPRAQHSRYAKTKA